MNIFWIFRVAFPVLVCNAAELDYPVTVSGNYWILGCGPQSATVQHLLLKVNEYVHEAVESIDGAGPVNYHVPAFVFPIGRTSQVLRHISAASALMTYVLFLIICPQRELLTLKSYR